MWKLLTTLASPAGPRSTLSVLFFHRVLASADPMLPDEPTAAGFDTLLGWIRSQFNVLALDEAVRRLADGSLPPAAAAITFDDGYRDNLEVAAPVLRRRGVPATFFIATGFLDGGIMWNDVVFESIRATRRESLQLPGLDIPRLGLHGWDERRHAVTTVLKAIKYLPYPQRAAAAASVATACDVEAPRDLMMTSSQVRELATAGFGIGAHTDTHPILSRLSDADANAEICRGRERLEAISDRRIGLFAYPNGHWRDDFDDRHIGMVERAGFDAAFTTEAGAGRIGSNRFALPRFTAWDRQPWRFKMRMMANTRQP